MPTTSELVFYAIINYIPYTLLALYPFKSVLRFSKAKTALLVCFFTVAVASLFVIGYNLGQSFHLYSTYIITIICFGFYFLAVKSRLGRMLFNLFMIKNFANFVVITAKCVEGFLFPKTIGTAYHWTNSLCVTLVLIPVFPFIMGIVKNYFSKQIRDSINPQVWKYLWLIPVFFYGIWMYVFYYSPSESPLQLALKPSMSIFMVVFTAGQILIYICIARLVIIFNRTTLLEEENNRLESQALQYRTIQDRIHEISKIKHDLRHQLVTLCNYADANEYDKLKDYLHQYVESIPDNKISYCSNPTLNMLLVFYAQRCHEEGISCNINLNIPDKIALSDSEITVLFGNLMENAVDACKTVFGDERYINVAGKQIQGQLVLAFENSYNNEIKIDNSGAMISTKHSGLGIGIACAGTASG